MNCIQLRCPLIGVCKHYNFLVDRGTKCDIQQKIIKAVEKLKEREDK